MPKTTETSSINIVDLIYTFGIVSWAKEVLDRPITFDYGELKQALAEIRQREGYRSSDASFAPAAIDPLSERQRKFIEAIEKRDFHVERIDYRQTYISRPVGPGADRPEASISTLSPNITYLLGLLAGRGYKSPEVLIVTGSYDAHHPLLDFVKNRNGRAGVAFFRQFLDPRWYSAGITDPGSPIAFHDLTPASQAILGLDWEQVAREAKEQEERSGFAAF